MPMYAENYKLNYDDQESYQDFQQSFPHISTKKSLYKKVDTTIYFNSSVNYCPYLVFEISKRVKKKLKTNCFQIEIELFCMYDNQSYTLSLSSKKGPLSFDNIVFELEKYLRKINLNNPISFVDIHMIESQKKLKLVHNKNNSKYNVFTSVSYKPMAEDIYLGLVKLDLDTH